MHPFHRMAENDDKLTHLRLKKIGFQTIETQNVKELNNRHVEAQSPAKFISRTADNGKRGPDDKKAAVPSITINCPESEVKLRQRAKSYTGGLMARRDSFKHSDAKIVVMGPRHVGKSAMTVRFLTKRFIGEYDSSKDLFYSHQITIDEELVNLEILDTGPLPDSQDTADRIMESRVIWGDIFLLVYSTTSRKSFNGMRPLHQAICAVKPHSVIMIVGNKQDLKQNRRVKKSEGEQLGFELKCPFWECSAAEGYGSVAECFKSVYKEAVKRKKEKRPSLSPKPFRSAFGKVFRRNSIKGFLLTPHG